MFYSLDISNIESAINISKSQMTESTTVDPVMNISYQNMQAVKKETAVYDADVNAILIKFQNCFNN